MSRPGRTLGVLDAPLDVEAIRKRAIDDGGPDCETCGEGIPKDGQTCIDGEDCIPNAEGFARLDRGALLAEIDRLRAELYALAEVRSRLVELHAAADRFRAAEDAVPYDGDEHGRAHVALVDAALAACPASDDEAAGEESGRWATMGYDIYIGEAVMDLPDDPTESVEIRVHVLGMAHPEAPSFPGDVMTGNGNSRHPSYSGWAEFCERHDLYAMFLDRDSGVALIQRHPGCAMLNREHHAKIEGALRKHLRSLPQGTIPGWDPNLNGIAAITGDGADSKYDGDLARLIWLEWWVRWALANCKVPAMYNR